ncbi:class I SAM-dependent methyltransferase [Microbacterium sp. HA-8]|uniref:class I SAM-dependent methyltransferase n=1 Tax=Microbacterium sp. HA-8 TaxID=3234200 RepID=UPI0038F6725C
MPLDLDDLRRAPDIEGPDLRAWDAADRLILDESAAARVGIDPGQIVVIGDTHGALALGAAADSRDSAVGGAGGGAVRAVGGAIRAHQDALLGERALIANAERLGLAGRVTSHPLDGALVRDARIVLMRLPRALDQLRDTAALIAAHAAPDVAVYAGRRVKHMALAMNDVLSERFDAIDVSHARQKSRVLIARGPYDGHDPEPRRATHAGLVVCAYGGVFAGTSIDIGTRLLLENLPDRIAGARADAAIDLACGSGVVAAALARQHPDLRVYACDQSAAAVASARATAEANGVADRVRVERDDALSALPDASASFITLNPPFHAGAAIHEGLGPRLFADAARVLRPGGELWTVFNSPLQYRPALERLVGPTRQIARNPKFTVTASTRR